MSLTRILAATALTGAVLLTAACGSSTDSGQGALGSTADPTPTTAAVEAPTPSATIATLPTTPSPTRAAKATPTPDQGGDGGADAVRGPATAGGGVCSHLSAQQVGAVLGVTVVGAAIPGQTGCTFRQGGKRGMSLTVLDKSAAQAGGMAGAKSEANSAVEGEPQDVTGIGSAGFVVTGSMFGGPDVNGAGAVQVGSRIIAVYLTQGSGIDAGRVRTLEVDLLTLVAHAKAA